MKIYTTDAPNRFRPTLVIRIRLPIVGRMRVEAPLLIKITRGR